MYKSQTQNRDTSITRFHKFKKKLVEQKEIYDRLKVGCDITECEAFDVIMLDGIICKNLCYEDKEMRTKINDYLVKNI